MRDSGSRRPPVKDLAGLEGQHGRRPLNKVRALLSIGTSASDAAMKS
jgi:hypothetical protein